MHACIKYATHRVQGGELVELLSEHVCQVKNANVEAILSDYEHQEEESWGILEDRAKIVIISCTHWQLSCSKHNLGIP